MRRSPGTCLAFAAPGIVGLDLRDLAASEEGLSNECLAGFVCFGTERGGQVEDGATTFGLRPV